MTQAPRVLVLPSWYPSTVEPTAGVFIERQVRALSDLADVAVIYVQHALEDTDPDLLDDAGLTVVRSSVRAKDRVGRVLAYTGAGLAAFDTLRASWGMPDIVHVQALWPASLLARAINRRWGIPYVVTEHSEEYLAASRRRLVRTPGMLRFVLRPLARSATATIAVSRFLADRLTQLELAVNPVVIPNVVPVSEFTTPPLTAPHLVGHVSVMGPAKNLDGLLRAVARLRQRRTDFQLQLVGDGELRPMLEVLATTLGLDQTVEFLGRRPPHEVSDLVARTSFTVVSSTHETFSVTAAESLMCGRPVLSTRCGGPEEFVTPEVGRLIEAGSVDALVEGLDWMLDHFLEFDPERLHEYARARFAPDVVAKQIMQVYEEVLGG